MAYGLLIRNGSNEVVIDSDFASLQKLRTGTLTNYYSMPSSAYPRSHTSRFFPYSPSSPNSLLFMKPAIGQTVTGPVALSDVGGNFSQVGVWSDDTTPIPFMEIVAANRIVGIPKPGWGLEIRAADGSLLFHSGAELIAVDDFYTIPSRVPDDQNPGNPYMTKTVGSAEWLCPRGAARGTYRVNIGASSSQLHFFLGGISRQNATTVGYNCMWYRAVSLSQTGRGVVFPGVRFFTS